MSACIARLMPSVTHKVCTTSAMAPCLAVAPACAAVVPGTGRIEEAGGSISSSVVLADRLGMRDSSRGER